VVLLPDYVSGANTANYLNILFGISAIGIAIAPTISETLGLDRRLASLSARLRRQDVTIATAGEGSVSAFDASGEGSPALLTNQDFDRLTAIAHGDGTGAGDILELSDVSVQFGGLVAVGGLTLHARRGAVTALIGPNGAGKTTTFNATSGLTKATSGELLLKGQDIGHFGPAHRARMGMARTFQEMHLFDGMSVFENLAVVPDAQDAGSLPWRQVLPRWKARKATEAQVREIARLCGIEDLLEKPAGLLSTAQRRLVDLAKALMASPELLLLDEPLSGVDIAEGEALMLLLRRLCDQRGTAILVVEHDMDFVVKMADYVYVLDFGRLIFEGDAASVMASEAVRDAYIGNAADGALEEEPA